MPHVIRTAIAVLSLTVSLSATSALPFLAMRPAHLPAPHADTLRSGYGVSDNCYVVEAKDARSGRTQLVQACD